MTSIYPSVVYCSVLFKSSHEENRETHGKRV